jgi:hypothetical protein
MTDAKADALNSQKSPYFRANLRLWSDTEPLARLVRASGRNWTEIDVKGETVNAKGRVAARIATRHYASSADTKYDDIDKIEPVLSQWVDDIERGAPPILALAIAGKVDAVLWISIFGHDEVPTPALPNELVARAKQAGLEILIENYTIMDDEGGNPAKSFFGVKD